MNLPYGQNEGDIWTGEGSPVQDKVDQANPGAILIHEMYDKENGRGVEEILYVTKEPGLIAKARQGDKIYGTVLCPRCGTDRYRPYASERNPDSDYVAPGFAPPALSRLTRGENANPRLYVCSACGQDEAMRDFNDLPPIPPDEWPLHSEGQYGIGNPGVKP